VVGPAALPNPDPVLPVIAASQATSEEPVATASHGGGHRSVGGGTGDTRDGHDGSGRPEAPRSGDTAPRSGDTGSAGPHGVEGEPVLVNPDGDLDRMFE